MRTAAPHFPRHESPWRRHSHVFDDVSALAHQLVRRVRTGTSTGFSATVEFLEVR